MIKLFKICPLPLTSFLHVNGQGAHCWPSLCIWTSSLRSLLVHVTQQSAVCSQRRDGGGRAEECSLSARLSHSAAALTRAVHACLFSSFMCFAWRWMHTCMFLHVRACVCVFAQPLLRCTGVLIVYFSMASCLQLKKIMEPLWGSEPFCCQGNLSVNGHPLGRGCHCVALSN